MAKKSPKADLRNLPAPAAEFIRLVIKKMRYRRKVRAEVMAELAAHFEDELKDCRNDEEREQKAQRLIEKFGDAKLLGILLRRAKKRCRPLWRTVVARTFQTGAILILCLVVYVIWFLSGRPNITVDYVAELNRMVRPTADESLNAGPFYNKAVQLYEEKSSDEISELLGTKYNEVTDKQKETIERWLNDNKEIFDLVTAGTDKPYYWQEYKETEGREGEGMISVIMPNLGEFRKITYALQWRAWLSAEKGLYDEALEDAMACYRLGRHLKPDKTIIEQLVGIAIEALALKTVRDIISEQKTDSAALAALQQDLEQITANESFVISVKTERLFMYDEIQRCFTEDRLGHGHIYLPRITGLIEMTESGRGEKGTWFDSFCADLVYYLQCGGLIFIHPNKKETLRTANEFYDYFEQLAVKSAAQMNAEREAIDTKFEKLFGKNVLMRTLAPALRRVIEQGNCNSTEVRATVAVVAILRYQQDTGSYPESLEELITAGYLEELPLDSFSDKPLVYKKTDGDFILYSVGRNCIDDGGQVWRDDKGRPRPWGDEGDAVFWPVFKPEIKKEQ
ncbi:MAG: hypothetical protein JSW23_04560 [Planctomycetota bacterium]|nr:MAG: hypothetical protein JSW23_04560 [Planctomycetota bacterium]